MKLLCRCVNCGAEISPELRSGSGGAAVVVECLCAVCSHSFVWRSSDLVAGTQVNHIDLVMSAAILFSGSQAAQAIRMFDIMNVPAVTRATFYRHQLKYLHKVYSCYGCIGFS